MEEDIKTAIDVMKKGGIILYPTDSIWGIGCDATNADAVKRIYELKRRTDNKAMLVLIDSADNIEKYVEEVPEIAYQLMELSEKPITIIYDNAYNLAHNILGDGNSIGIRVSREKFSHELCKAFRKPIVSTSANISGDPVASIYAEINEDVKAGVDYIVKYRQNDTTPHNASSIIKLASDGSFKILRP